MNGRIFRLDVPAHQAVQELLPWYLSGQLAAAEAQRVQEHLQGCLQCQQDLEWERRLRATPRPAPDGLDVERALGQLLPRLGAQQQPSRRSWWRGVAANQPSWTRWAMAAQFAVIAGLALLLARPDDHAASYHVLGAASHAAAGNLVVVFKPETTEQTMRRLLQANDARVVDGPTETAAYLLSVPAANRAHALASLRAEPAVALVESLDSGAAP